MFKSIFNTTVVRLFNAVITFTILLINARVLGSDNVGTIGLIVLNITIVLMVNNLFGGGALIYLTPRYPAKKLLSIAYFWAFLTALIVPSVFLFLRIEPLDYIVHVYCLSLFLSLAAINQNFLLGKQRINYFNFLALIQYLALLAATVILYFVFKNMSVDAYIRAMYIAWGINLVIGFILIYRIVSVEQITQSSQHIFRDMLKYGFFVQVANLAQFLNYRLSYFFIQRFLGLGKLGVYEVTTRMAEGVWLFGRSIALVQYMNISNSDDAQANKQLTLRLFRFSFVISLALVLILISIPESLYLAIFGNDFNGIYITILLLSPGIIAIACSTIISHYFAGTGRHYLNAIGSGIGLIAIIVLCLVLIPRYGLPGAAIAASITYTITLIYNLWLFILKTGAHFNDFLFKYADLQHTIEFFRQSVMKQSKRE